MISFYTLGVFILLSVVELEATSVSRSSCPKRNLTVTVDDQFRLYFDGVEIIDLPNVESSSKPDIVDLPCTTRLIAIHGKNYKSWAGILASTDDEYVLTNSSWKCSNISHVGWEGIDFDDCAWMSAIEYGPSRVSIWPSVPGISSNASWIWLRQVSASTYEDMDIQIYCRKRIGCYCSCFEGYTNDGSESCKASSTDSHKTAAIILGVLFGVSVCAIVVLILLVYYLRKKIAREEDRDEGQNDMENAMVDEQNADQNSLAGVEGIENPNLRLVDNMQIDVYGSRNQIPENDIAPVNVPINPEAHAYLNLET